MVLKLVFVYLTTVSVLINGKSWDILRDSSLLKVLNDHYTSVHYDQGSWSQEDPLDRKDIDSDSSQGYDWYPGTNYQTPGYWNAQSSSSWNYNDSVKSNEFYRTSLENTAGNLYSTSNRDGLKSSQSVIQYQKIRPAASSYIPIKKFPPYYPKTSLQIKGTKNSGSLKYKQVAPLVYYSPSGYKKTTYPRVHKPYAKHKYPAQKTVHSSYRRYYRSPYQQYSINANDVAQKTFQKPTGYSSEQYNHFRAPDSTYATVTSNRYYTTERMDDIYSTTSEDNLNYNTTGSKTQSTFYENYDEGEKSTIDSDLTSYDETSTRGYYGDRIYMSTQAPLKNYFIVRKVADDDDIETIFE